MKSLYFVKCDYPKMNNKDHNLNIGYRKNI